MAKTEDAKPRSVQALRKAWEALMCGPGSDQPESAHEIERLLDEANPHGIGNRVHDVRNVDTGNGRCLIEAVLSKKIRAGGEETLIVKVHPALAAVDAPAQTVRQLDRAMSNADARGMWEQVGHIATALIAVLGVRPRTSGDCEKVREAVRELYFGRLAVADSRLYERLQEAVQKHTSEMQFVGSHHRLAGRTGSA